MFRCSRSRLRYFSASLPICLLAAASGAWAGDLKLTLAPAFTSGDYGSTIRTDTFEMPLKIRYQEGPFKVTVKIPYLAVTGPQTAIPSLGTVAGSPSNGSRRGRNVIRSGSGGGGPGPSGNSGSGGSSGSGSDDVALTSSSPNTRSTVQGLGDLGLSASARMFGGQKGDWLTVEIGAGMKLPTGDKGRGLGTGQLGFSTQIAATVDFTPALSLETTFGRFFRTNQNNDLQLRDYFYASSSLSYDVNQKWTVGVSADIQERVVAGGTPIVEAGLFAEYEIMPGTKIGANVFHGFTRDSSEWGAGVLLSHKFSL